MARLAVAVSSFSRAGVKPTLGAMTQADGVKIADAADSKTVARVDNTTGAPIVVTQLIPATTDTIAVVNGGRQVTIPANDYKYLGPWGREYKQSDSAVYIDAAADGCNVTAMRLV